MLPEKYPSKTGLLSEVDSQKRTNQEFLRTFPLHNGLNIPVIEQPPTRATTLRKPYQYCITIAQAKKMLADIKNLLNKDAITGQLQCDLICTKSIKFGIRLDFFLLACSPGLTSKGSGLSEQEWIRITSSAKTIFEAGLGECPEMYIEPWSDSKKFQAQFETYIMYQELVELHTS